MSSLNRATLIGNVGRDPETRAMQNGGKVVSFSLATSESWKDKDSGEKRERVNWHNIVVFNEHIAGVVERFVKKGSKILIEGSIETRKYEKDGQERYTTEIVLRQFAGNLVLLGEVGGTQARSDPDAYGTTRAREMPASEARKGAGGVPIDDDIPF